MDIRGEYRRICQKLTDTLITDEMTAILVQLKIDRATRSTVTDGRKFIDILEMRGLIGVGNFQRLVPLLKDHELDHLAIVLERYMEEHKKAVQQHDTGSIAPSNIVVDTGNTSKEQFIYTEEKEASSIKTSDICGEHKTPQEVICLACYTKVCYACAYMYHQDHEVVSMDDLSAKVNDEVKAVRSVFETLEKDTKDLEDGIKRLTAKMQSPFEYRLQCIVENSLQITQTLYKRCIDSVNEVTQFGVTYLTQITKVLTEVDNEIFFTEEDINAKLYDDNFAKLYEINKTEKNIKDSESNINKISQQLKDGSMEVSIRPSSISANLARLTYGCVLGAVMASKDQMVIIRSQGNPSTSLEVASTSCLNPANLYWAYTFTDEQGNYPYVLGPTLHIAPRTMDIVVGCGRKLIIFQVDSTKDILYFVNMTTKNLEIPKDSHITGVSRVSSKMQDKGVIVSDKNSGVVRILDNNFNLIKKVEYHGESDMIACVLKENVYKFAVASFNSQSVLLLKANLEEEMSRQFARLRVQNNSDLNAQSLFFDGTFFTVLWVSGEESYNEGQRWKVVAYKEDGEEFNVCKEGSCDPNITAVSISHVKGDMLLCFSNGAVDSFPTYKV